LMGLSSERALMLKLWVLFKITTTVVNIKLVLQLVLNQVESHQVALVAMKHCHLQFKKLCPIVIPKVFNQALMMKGGLFNLLIDDQLSLVIGHLHL